MRIKDKYIFKTLISILIFLILAILCKADYRYHNTIKYYLYINSFNFNSIYNFYNKYLGGTQFYRNNDNLVSVYNEELKYSSLSLYKKGIKLKVDNKYLTPSLKDGIIIFIGNKDEYKNVIILQTNNNINIWYSNICNSPLKIYDKIEKGEYIGESCQDYIYIAYEKNGQFLNYKEYFF